LSAQHIVHSSLGHAQPLQNSSQTLPLVGSIVVIVAAVSGIVVDSPLVVPSPLDSAGPPDDASPELLAPPLLPPLLPPSLVASSVSLALDDIELAAVADALPLNGSSSRLFTEHAANTIITPSIRMPSSSPIERNGSARAHERSRILTAGTSTRTDRTGC
jgi:hypothetical protein